MSEHYRYEKGINTSELAENHQLTQALDMLNIVINDLDPEDFTLDQIQQGYNAIGQVGDSEETDFKTTRIRYGKSHFDTLLNKNFIEEDPDQEGHYHVTGEGMEWYEQQPDAQDLTSIEEGDL